MNSPVEMPLVFPGIFSVMEKQSGSLHNSLSQIGALFGSVAASQTFSSDPSAQSVSPLQKRFLGIQVASPQASSLGPSQRGVSVTKRGFTFFSLVSLSQFFTAHFQSQVCFSRSNASPGGHLMA